jgi:hypothetical protein
MPIVLEEEREQLRTLDEDLKCSSGTNMAIIGTFIVAILTFSEALPHLLDWLNAETNEFMTEETEETVHLDPANQHRAEKPAVDWESALFIEKSPGKREIRDGTTYKKVGKFEATSTHFNGNNRISGNVFDENGKLVRTFWAEREKTVFFETVGTNYHMG